MASNQYFEFLGTVWNQLPDADKARMGELWEGYEQVLAATYQKFAEGNLNATIRDLQPFTTERWLKYTFNDSNAVNQPAILTSTQDLSQGINLSGGSLLRIAVDSGTPIEVDVAGVDPLQTTLAEIVTKINAAFGFTFASTVFNNSVLRLRSSTSGINSKIEVLETSDPAQNASEFVLGILGTDLPKAVPEFPFIYTPSVSNIVSIPFFRNAVRDENVTVTLTEGADHSIDESKNIAFKSQPPEILWAKRTLIDEETPFNNFGFLMDIFQENNQRYVEVLQGLWFAFWTGPKPRNVEIALYLLFGLPTALEAGTVTRVTATEIDTTSNEGLVRTFEIPSGLVAIVAVGDSVVRFDPLVNGVRVLDKINSPGFIEEEIGRAGIQRFLTDDASRGTGDTDETKALRMLEEYTFLPQIQVEAFNEDVDLQNVRTFLDAIKPLNKTFLFQVVRGDFRDEIELEDRDGNQLEINLTENLDANQTTDLDQATLDLNETTPLEGLNLDPNGLSFNESVDIEVKSFGVTIDQFTI